MRALLCLLLCAGPALADDGLERARAAVRSEPGRPGLRLALAAHLLRIGALDAAAGEARQILRDWPESSRARLVLARVALIRGDLPTARALLAEVEKNGARLARDEARRLQAGANPVPSAGRLLAWGRAAGQFDSRAVSTPSVFVAPHVLGDTPAARGILGGGVGYAQGRWIGRFGLERTVHTSLGDEEVTALDRTSLWLEGRAEVPVGVSVFGVALLGRGAFAGRALEPAYAGGGGSAWWRYAAGSVHPWARVRALALTLAEAEPLAWVEASTGTDVRFGITDVGVRLDGTWLGPGALGYREGEISLRLAVHAGWVRPFLGAGAGFRQDGRGARPRALGGLRVGLGEHMAVVIDGAWQSVEQRHRFLAGVGIEVWR